MENVFSKNLLAWRLLHGRHNLPWQQQLTPYRVWVSEIMLQQTQVATVIKYYQKFIDTFPSIDLLATASLDEVLTLWSGLGYYARARNLHRCAQIIHEQYNGKFPQDVHALSSLPGIGRSTAGAILSLGMNIREPILDGNVKRVLTRYFTLEGNVSDGKTIKKLWIEAERLTPQKNYAEYNQAMMDLGATVCIQHKPKCSECPVSSNCLAHRHSRTHEFPFSKVSARSRPIKYTQMLLLKDPAGRIFLEKRPPLGIWGGLWSFPECGMDEDLSVWCRNKGIKILNINKLKKFSHVFSHFELMIHPTLLTVEHPSGVIMEASEQIWYHSQEVFPGGLPAPISKLLNWLKGE